MIEDELQAIIDANIVGEQSVSILNRAIEEIERLREFEFMYQSVSK